MGTEGQAMMKIDNRVMPVETHIDEATLVDVAPYDRRELLPRKEYKRS